MSVNKVNSDGSLSRVAGGTLYADLAVGSIVPFGGSAVPSGYLLCNGAEVLKTAYADLRVLRMRIQEKYLSGERVSTDWR